MNKSIYAEIILSTPVTNASGKEVNRLQTKLHVTAAVPLEAGGEITSFAKNRVGHAVQMFLQNLAFTDKVGLRAIQTGISRWNDEQPIAVDRLFMDNLRIRVIIRTQTVLERQ